MKKSITFKELKRLVNEGCPSCKTRKFDEGWSDDPNNDDYKKNPDGTFMRDANGKKIPITFADDLADLKKKISTVSGDVKQKIMQFLFGGQANVAYNESYSDDEMYGVDSMWLDKVLVVATYKEDKEDGGRYFPKFYKYFIVNSSNSSIKRCMTRVENEMTRNHLYNCSTAVFRGKYAEYALNLIKKNHFETGDDTSPIYFEQYRLMSMMDKEKRGSGTKQFDESSDKSDVVGFLDSFEANQGGEVAVLTQSEEGRNYFTGVIADWMVNNDVEIGLVRKYKSIWNNINPSLLPSLINKFKKNKKMDDEYDRRKDAEAWAEDRMASMSDELGIPEDELNESRKVTLTMGQLKKLIR